MFMDARIMACLWNAHGFGECCCWSIKKRPRLRFNLRYRESRVGVNEKVFTLSDESKLKAKLHCIRVCNVHRDRRQRGKHMRQETMQLLYLEIPFLRRIHIALDSPTFFNQKHAPRRNAALRGCRLGR